ncbi:putative uncharacterized protein [Firmicutes bacterium CAG:582]|nr:putative uncharacterized protein [Firmicutes bacterium CAG:582]
MKKILIITCLALLTLVGILIPKFLPKESNHEYKKEEKNIITVTSITEKVFKEEFTTLMKKSDAVVKGKVVSVNFETFAGNAWTKITLQIDDVFKGEVKKNQDIDIYYLGGYISLNDHINFYKDSERFSNLGENEKANTILKEIVDGEEFIAKDEELILCIVKTSEASPLPKGSYERLYASGMLKEKDNQYVQVYGEFDPKFKIDKNKLNNLKKIINE